MSILGLLTIAGVAGLIVLALAIWGIAELAKRR
jgi:hypothetical protein